MTRLSDRETKHMASLVRALRNVHRQSSGSEDHFGVDRAAGIYIVGVDGEPEIARRIGRLLAETFGIETP